MTDAVTTMGERVNQSELARRLNVSRQAVHDLVQRGILAMDERGDIDIDAARAAIDANLRPDSKASRGASDPVDNSHATALNRARAANEAALAAINELKLRELQGELIRVDAVRAALAGLLSSTRDSLFQIPARVSPVLAAETDAQRIYEALERELAQCLQQILALPEQLGGPEPEASS